MNHPRILIVGAGITGLLLARDLLRKGINADVVERTPIWSEEGAGICLPANAVAGFYRLGLKDDLLNKAHQVDRVEYALDNGRTLAEASLLEPPLDVAPFLALPRAELLNILRPGMDDRVRFGVTVKSLQQRDQVVTVTFSTGEQSNYDLVVGADGIHSSIRRMLFANSDAIPLGITAWRFVVSSDTKNIHPVYYIGNDSAFMIYPIGPSQVYCYGQIVDKKATYLKEDPYALLHRLFGHYCFPVQQMLAKLTRDVPVISGVLESVPRVNAVSGRVVLIGDALHGCPPTLQQGVGQGLEDVICLTDSLQHLDIVAALKRFEEIRLPRVEWVVEESNRIIKLAATGHFWLGRWFRNAIIRKNGPANVVGWRKLLHETMR